MPMIDQAILQKPKQLESTLEFMREAFKSGVEGAAQELELFSQPWGFDLKDVHFPLIIWQGQLDKQVSPAHALLYQQKLTQTSLYLFENDGHLSMLYNYIEDILESLRPPISKTP